MLNNKKNRGPKQCFIFLLSTILITSCSLMLEQNHKKYDAFKINKNHLIEVIGELGNPDYRYDLGKNIPNKKCPIILTYVEHVENFSLLSPNEQYDNYHLYVFNADAFLEKYQKFEKCTSLGRTCKNLLDSFVQQYSQKDALSRSCYPSTSIKLTEDSNIQEQNNDSIPFVDTTIDDNDSNSPSDAINDHNKGDSLEDYAD